MTTGSFGGYSVPRYAPERGTFGRLTARDSVLRRMDWMLLLAAARAVRHRLAAGLVGHPRPDRHRPRRPAVLPDPPPDEPGDRDRPGRRHHRARPPQAAQRRPGALRAVDTAGCSPCCRPLGSTVNGAHSWIVIGGGFSLQPSEFAKIAIILGMAMMLSARVDAGDRANPDHRTVLQALGLAAVPMGVIMLMPDLGSIMVMVVIVLGVLLASGASNRWVFGLIAAGAAGRPRDLAARPAQQVPDRPLRRLRQPGPRPARASATTPPRPGSPSAPAACIGKGLFHGTQTTGQFVPEQQTDFVFTVAGEELGFVGAGADHRAARHHPVAGLPHRPPGHRPVRHARRRRRGLLVRLPGVREHRHDARHHAGGRHPAAVRLATADRRCSPSGSA